jgi:hypothetical protein
LTLASQDATILKETMNNFLTKLKNLRTNWKRVLILVVLSFVIGGVLVWQLGVTEKELKMPKLRVSEKRITEPDIGRCLPNGYSLVNTLERRQADLNNDHKEEIILTIEKERVSELTSCSKTFIISLGDAGCKLEWESEKICAYGPSILIEDLNQNDILNLLIQPGWGGVSKQIIIVEWNGESYEVLFDKHTLNLSARGGVSSNLKDLDGDGKLEIILGEYEIYHVPYPPKPSALMDLLWYTVYKWDSDSKRYIEATTEFLEVFDYDIRLAEELLKYSQIKKWHKEISQYINKVNKLRQ